MPLTIVFTVSFNAHQLCDALTSHPLCDLYLTSDLCPDLTFTSVYPLADLYERKMTSLSVRPSTVTNNQYMSDLCLTSA